MKEVAVFASRKNTGACCVSSLVKRGYKVRAISRAGTLSDDQKGNDNVVPIVGDVTKPETLQKCVEGVECVIFAASSTAGWRLPGRSDTPPHVDYKGCMFVAEACVQYNVPQFIIISSACVTRSMFSSVPYLLLNSMFGRIMYWKRRGEIEAQAEIEKNPNCCWTIIRPGALLSTKAKEPKDISIFTEDTVSAAITRENVGEIVAAAVGNRSARNIALNCVGIPSGASSYEELFESLHGNE